MRSHSAEASPIFRVPEKNFSRNSVRFLAVSPRFSGKAAGSALALSPCGSLPRALVLAQRVHLDLAAPCLRAVWVTAAFVTLSPGDALQGRPRQQLCLGKRTQAQWDKPTVLSTHAHTSPPRKTDFSSEDEAALSSRVSQTFSLHHASSTNHIRPPR